MSNNQDPREDGTMAKAYFVSLAEKYDIDLNVPVKDLAKDKIKILLYGSQS
mgnify:CR=1 FL=1